MRRSFFRKEENIMGKIEKKFNRGIQAAKTIGEESVKRGG